jgi:hypothetical protein
VSERVLEGGCLCGSLRYAARGDAIDAGYCHCRVCQRSAGAPALAWASFALDSFAYTEGTPASYRSSAQACREFCSSCGTQILFQQDARSRVDLTLASLDHPEAIAPEYHIWTDAQIPWFDTVDALSRYVDEGPDDAAE